MDAGKVGAGRDCRGRKRSGEFLPWKRVPKGKYSSSDHVSKSDAKVLLSRPNDGSGQAGEPPRLANFALDWRPFVSTRDIAGDQLIEERVKAAIDYFEKNAGQLESLEELLNTRRFYVVLGDLMSNRVLRERWPSLQSDVDNNIEKVLGIFGMARTTLAAKESPIHTFPSIQARVNDFDDFRITPIGELKANLIETVVDIKGTVIRVSNVKPLCTWLTFKCVKCDSLFSQEQPYGVYTEPNRCDVLKCKSTMFSPLRSHPQTLAVDWQTIRLQETTQAEQGRVPRTLDCILVEDLCDVAVPGDVVCVKGRLRSSSGVNGASCSTTIHSFVIHAVSVSNQKVLDSNKRSANAVLNFSLLDYSAVQEIHGFKSSLLRLLVASLCPSIYGNELVKAGMLLGLFGGTVKCSTSEDKVPVRGDPHMLVIGDPGLGKSQMLSCCASVAPRGVFVAGTGATASGLTVTVSKEGNEFCLEAGALVLADQGCCCIDEFDKMTSHQALLEAMEQQSVSIAKSGIVCSLPARTSIIAAANPIGGHYNRTKSVSENVKLSPALLSRFDIIFILIDKPDEQQDLFLSDHIMNRQSKSGWEQKSSNFTLRSDSSTPNDNASLKERLRTAPGDNLDLIPHSIMRKYIAYARHYVAPKLTSESANVIQQFYLELRRNYQTADCSPITVRQLESLIRLTEARARLELREEATAQDAEDVIEIVKSTFVDTFGDELGKLDFSRAINGSGVSSRSKVKIYMSALHKLAHAQSKNTFDTKELKRLMLAVGVEVDNFFDFMQNLSHQGYIIKKPNGCYQLLSAEF